MAKVTGSLQKSTEIMKLSNQLVKLPQISQAMREMSMEMTKVRRAVASVVLFLTGVQAGILEEMMDDTLAVEEDEELEEEADAEVDKVLFDLTNGKLGQAGKVETEVPVSAFRHGADTSINLTRLLVPGGQDDRRGDRARDGTIPTTAERVTELRGRTSFHDYILVVVWISECAMYNITTLENFTL